jgi:hypothetical protein
MVHLAPTPRPARTNHRRQPLPDAGGLFTTRDAAIADWTPSASRHAIATQRWRRFRPGVFDLPDDPAQELPHHDAARQANLRSARASTRSCERAVISHASAAIEYGLPTVCRLERPCLTVPAGTALRSLADVHLHRATLPAEEVARRIGYRTTAPARTILDLAREHGIDAGVAAADAALRTGLMTSGELEAALEICAGWPGRAAALTTVDMCDARAESPLESLSRVRLLRARMPAFELQVEIGDEHGIFVARTDFYWPQFGVIGEADGNTKYDGGRAALVAERRRQQALEDLGLVLVRWEWADLARFDVVTSRLSAAFGRGALPGSRQRRWSTLRPRGTLLC